MTDRYKKILTDPVFQEHMKIINESEKDRIFCCHGIAHLADTARISYIISLENSAGIPKDIIYAAALVHDLGRACSDTDVPHSVAGLKAAEKILENCGYTGDEIALVTDAVSAHSHKNETPDISSLSDLSAILSKADTLSRQCFCCPALDECNWPGEKINRTLIY